ncbi:DnaJ domain-containing protein [Kribbella sp. NPDC050459]|uniref:DUF4190 domain-containing protein n=1 Tax=Kribbella sp. NPDC050459 TaxID=3155785 RepID=UPI0033F17860
MNSRRDFRDLDGADPWKLLGVARDAGPEEIKRSYRRLSRSHHTDVGGSATQQAKLNRAYEILSDPNRRADYAVLLNPKPKPPETPHRPTPDEPADDPFEWSSGPAPTPPRRDTYTPPRHPRQNPHTAPPYRESYTAPPYNDPFTAPTYQPRRHPGVSRQAVAALLTVPFCSLVSIYLAVTALRQIQWSGQRGKSIAWLALLLNIALFVFVIIGGVLTKL